MEGKDNKHISQSFRLEKGNKVTNFIGCLGLLILLSLGLIGLSQSSTSQPVLQQSLSTPTDVKGQTSQQASPASSQPQKQESGQRDIDANVNYSSTAFKITNNEDKDWNKCKLEMNSHGFSSGYVYYTDVIKAKDAFIVSFSEFTKGDGTRFNVLDTKPLNLSISCDDVGGQRGWNYFAI